MSFKRFFYTFILVCVSFSKIYAPSSDFSVVFVDNYENVIAFIKKHEGFSETLYYDDGYQAIGYGVRVQFTNFKAKKITKEQADSLLRAVFEQNKTYVLYHFSDSINSNSNNQLLAISHLSYSVGIGQLLKQARKHGFNSILTRSYGQCKCIRDFEIMMFKEPDFKLTKYYEF